MKQKHKHSPAGNKVAPTSLEITWRNVANTNGAFPFEEINKSYSTERSDVKMQKSGQPKLQVTSMQWQAIRNMAASLDFCFFGTILT